MRASSSAAADLSFFDIVRLSRWELFVDGRRKWAAIILGGLLLLYPVVAAFGIIPSDPSSTVALITLFVFFGAMGSLLVVFTRLAWQDPALTDVTFPALHIRRYGFANCL